MDDDTLVLPPGMKKGCLLRQSRYGDVCRLLTDVIEEIPADQQEAMIGKVNLRLHVKQILHQNYGSCATESTTQGLMIVRNVAGYPFELLNPLFIYHHTSGGRDNGSNIDTNLNFAREKGIAPEKVWPRSKGFRATPSDEAYEAAKQFRIEEFYDIGTVNQIRTALLIGFPVVFGWSGHSCVLTRVLSMTKGEYADSGGTGRGDNGFLTINFSSINFGYGAFAVRTPNWGGNVPVPPEPK